MTSEKICRKDKNQNIQVFVRIRPLNQRERDIKSLGVVEVTNSREVVVRQSQQTSLTKKFTFDKAFGPFSKQVEVYQDVVSPLIEEVLAGYNCTVFAYGQTGTGKTHTMVGENTGDQSTWQTDPMAGIIPRALSQLFDELRISNTEYTVRVSYLELYNEELFDLLSTSEDNSKLRIYEDITRKGSNIVNGLEEITVHNKSEVFKIMAQGQERKRVASTLMNAQSSRSHTVFTIVVHMKENSPEGEEFMKIGKLNLVDLAGSENISKAGSDNKKERARESVNINQSLLTLGRVITALVERHPHIPYRESKLTRLLQESLGGRTKTSIIATISPGHKDLEETMSTLEYAHRAKNIQNKPEINQKMTKKAVLKEYTEEIDRLKRDLQASRDKSGVYLANETYMELTLKQEEQKKEIQGLLLKKKAMEDERDKMEAVFSEMSQQLDLRNRELDNTKNALVATKGELVNTSNLLKTTEVQFNEQKYLVEKQKDTEAKLSRQARELLATAHTVTEHVATLHDVVDKRRTIESMNLEVTKTYREEAAQQRELIRSSVGSFADTLLADIALIVSGVDGHTNCSMEQQELTKQKLDKMAHTIAAAMNELKSLSESSSTEVSSLGSQLAEKLQLASMKHHSSLSARLLQLATASHEAVHSAAAHDVPAQLHAFAKDWFASASDRVKSIQKVHSNFAANIDRVENQRGDLHQTHKEQKLQAITSRNDHINACIHELEEEKVLFSERLQKQLSDMEIEKQETERRLAEYVEQERKALDVKLKNKMAALEEEKELLYRRIDKMIESQQKQLESNREELERVEREFQDHVVGGRETLKCVSSYGKEIDEGTRAISIDMEAFSGNVVDVAEHHVTLQLAQLREANAAIQEEVPKIADSARVSSEQLVRDACESLARVAADTTTAFDRFLQSIEQNNSTTIEELTNLSTVTSELITNEETHRHTTSSTLESARSRVETLVQRVSAQTEEQANIQDKYLAQEYRVYSPSGKTPVRQQFQYPRQLAATSPHHQLLARLRSEYQPAEEKCIVIESDESRPESDCESEESTASSSPSDCAILKSRSENDIFKHQRQVNGQENQERSVSMKKPSKLRAPSKKPLTERNVYQQ